DQALDQLVQLPYESLGEFANVDHHRAIRTGFPEVIYSQGKTVDQIVQIFGKLEKRSQQVLATRVTQDQYNQIQGRLPQAVYHAAARVLYIDKNPDRELKPGIVVITAGTSDIPVAEEAAITAELMGHQVQRIFDVGVAGLHRLLDRLPEITKANVLVVIAGMEGALPTVVGGLVSAPVIAVPTSIGYGASFGGIAALLGMLNSCANGVAVVNIDNGYGAGCLAAKINRLAVEGPK
ncbi:MAG TPA: nickel pincer cofactor biosynthesis protein LarB, partial [Longilinea sp.]|nr:nickel pincer cofactor biosynthesis protein LarB [Longilinea sp.]